MADLCKECFIEVWNPSQKDIDNIVMSDYDEFCECCMELLPFVDHIAAGFCPECGSELECMCVMAPGESGHDKEERLLHCYTCLRDWRDIEGNCQLERKFWG